jgi:predicted phage terminase large subunit-like protein
MSVADLLKQAAMSRPMLADHLAQDFAAFVRAAWPSVNPGRKLHWNWSYDLLCEYLQLVQQRKILRLIINVPPRSGKTTIAGVCYPCWVWLKEPSHRFLCSSYEMTLAKDTNVMRRNLISSGRYQKLFADRFTLAQDRNLAEQFANDHEGAMVATSIDARAMGRGGDTIILDDVLTQEQALSDITRKSVNDWLSHTMLQRLNDPAESAIILIMQRVHEADPTGYFLETEPRIWTHLKLQLIAEQDERWTLPISGRVIERKRGECLHPKRFPPKVVEQKQRDRFTFAGQFQQEPAPLEGNLIKRGDVRYYGGVDPLTGARDEDLPTRFDQKIISVDCSFKDLNTSDYVAILVVGVSGRKRFVLNVVNAHLDAAATETEIRRQREMHSPISGVLIEDKANGSAVIQRLRLNVPGIVEIEPQGGKAARMQAASPEWQAGDWYVCRNAAWCEPFLGQLLMFPAGRHDDMADAMSQSAIWLQGLSFPEDSWMIAGPKKWKEEMQRTKDGVEVFLMVGDLVKLSNGDGQDKLMSDSWLAALNQLGREKLFGQDTGAVNKPLVTAAPDVLLDFQICPACGNDNLAKVGDYRRCNCGWDNKTSNPLNRTLKIATANACPECGKLLSIAGEWRRCNNCGWESREPKAPLPRPTQSITKVTGLSQFDRARMGI